MPQNIITEIELRHLAATPYQIINPGSNKPIIGIFQDSLLGSYRFTRKDIHFTPLQAMNLLMMYPHVQVDELRRLYEEDPSHLISNFNVLSQIMPPLTLKYKTGLFDEEEDPKTSNNVLEIRAGQYVRGQLEKGVFDAATKGILHRICNDFGNMACADFNDNMQNIVTEYMKTSSFSVGISDLIADRKTNEEIITCIKKQKMEVQTIIDKVHLGIFENKTANTNAVHFEQEVSNILNKATEHAGKIGKKSLSKDNRFLMIVESGSKGNLINISQMVSCLGQQSVDGKRISYGFDDRTLPHFKKYDDSPNARGFVENSYITGLSAPELFFHAMAGRTGLIDTAVKSVTRETPIVIIQEGKPLYTAIGDWIDGKLDDPENAGRITHYPNDRNMELLNIPEGVYIPTTDEDGRVTWGDVTAVTRHDPGERLYEITTESGRTVTVAESQSLLVWDTMQRKFLPKNCPEVQVGDNVPVTVSLGIPTNSSDKLVFYAKQEAENLLNGLFNVDLLFATNQVIYNIVDALFKLPEPTTIHVKTVEAMNGVSLLCSRVHLHVKLDFAACTVTMKSDYVPQNDVVLDPIVNIRVIGTEAHPKLYDLTIPSTLNFGLANGLQVRDTSSTGYIQRRLVKGLEDLMVNYDMTVRNNKGKIIQFQYGDDNFDATKVENQILPLIEMTVEDMYMYYDLPGMNEAENNIRLAVFTKAAVSRMNKQRVQCKEQCLKYTERLMEARDLIVEKVFASQNEKSVRIPIAFQYIIANIQGQLHLDENSAVDITPLEAFKMIESYFERICAIPCVKVNRLIEIAYYYYLTPRDLLVKRRFHEKGLRLLLETIVLKFKEALVHPGEMVGVVAAQGCGEPTTQLSILRTENIKVVRVNKKTQVPEMVSGEIGTLCDRIITQLPEYTFDTGHQDSVETVLEPLEDEYYIVGVDEKEQTHWNRISHVSRHIVNGDMIRVKTRSGRVVDTTMSHSHLVRKDQSVQPILGSDMTVGMRIPVAKHIDNAFVRDSVAIADHIHVLDREFGWFVGAYLAEGCLVKKKGSEEATGTISISNVSEYYIQLVGQFAGRFGRTCRTKSKTAPILGSAKSYTNADTSFTFKPLADFLMSTCGTGSFKKRVPDFAFLAPDDFKAGLLAGYMDGDGNFMCDKLHHQIRVCSRSEQLIKDVSLLFGYLDIFGSLHTGYRNGANYYHLAISPKYAETYEERIGSHLHADKLRALVDYTKRTGVHSLREDTDRINGLGEVIAACGKTLELPGQSRLYRRWLKKDAIGRNTLEKYIQEFEQHDKAGLIQKELAVLKQAAYSHVVWDEIVEIERYTPDQTEYVYDFTVPGNQTFMTDYGVIVHNTLNSCCWSDKITVKDKNGHIVVMPIGEFTEKHIELSRKIDYNAANDTTYAELDKDETYYEVPCATEDGRTVWRRVEAVTQHPVVNEDGTNTMLKVNVQTGQEVTATKAKSFLQLIDGKIQGVHGKDLKVGDYLPVSRKALDYKETYELELRTILPMTEYIYGSEMQKAAAVMHEHHWWKTHANTTFTVPFQRSDSVVVAIKKSRKGQENRIEYESGQIYTKTNIICNYKIPEVIDLDYDFGYLLGAYCAEGCTTKHQISIANNDLVYFQPIMRVCDKFNLKYKMYSHKDKNKEGWTSSDMRIYSTILTRILTKLCGKLSHLKQVSSQIVFSNRDCVLGFLDAYISGDGTISQNKQKIPTNISISSTSKSMLTDVSVMLRNLGVSCTIGKGVQVTHNNRGTLPENIQPVYGMYIGVKDSQILASMLNLTVANKQEKLQKLIKRSLRSASDIFPNRVNGELVKEPRNGRMMDLRFAPIVSIEEVPNPTKYAYDLTVEETRTFDLYNGLALFDTFHNTGVASKTGVTRGVPRIEEILRLTKNPKNPSMTVFMNPQEEMDIEKVNNYAVALTHTKLIDVVQSVQVYFDPMEQTTQIEEDRVLLEQFYQFEEMVAECMGEDGTAEPGAEPAKSKWVIRMEIDKEILIEKNLTMDDIHFAVANSHYGKDVHCVFSDYNMDKLVFRIRTNANIFDKKPKRGVANPLDQSDEIYLLKNFQDALLNQIVLRGIHGVKNVLSRKLQNTVFKEEGKYVRKDTWVLDSTGSNLLDTLALDFIDATRTTTNDIKEVFDVLGIEAARKCIHTELVDVMAAAGASINYHHTSLLCDRMTCNKDMVSIFRSGLLNDNVGPIAKATFEVHTEVFLDAARHAEFDHMKGVSANIMCGQQGDYGTNAFQVVLDMKAYESLKGAAYQRRDVNREIEEGLVAPTDDTTCGTRMEIQNNIASIRRTTDHAAACLDDGYDIGF